MLFAPFLIALGVVGAAELFLRVMDGTRTFNYPVRYGVLYFDVQRKIFLKEFLPQAKDPGVLILGSSVADTNINPQWLRHHVRERTGQRWSIFNGGLYAGRTEDTLYLLDWYKEQWDYQRLIMVVDPGLLRQHRLAGLRESLSANAVERWLKDHTMLFAYRRRLSQYDPQVSGAIYFVDADSAVDGWNRTEHWANQMSLEDQAWHAARGFIGMEPDGAGLQRIADRAAAMGLDVTWVVPPYSRMLESQMPREMSTDRAAALARAMAAQHGQRFLDLRGVRFPREDWSDSAHLNGAGAQKFSWLMGDRLARMWAEGVLSHVEPEQLLTDEHYPTTNPIGPLN